MITPYFLPFEYPARKHNRTHRVWVAPVSAKQEELWGTLVALIRLPDDTTNPDTATSTLCDLFTKLYYPSSITRRVNNAQGTDREIRFEEMLQELNTSFENPERFGIPESEDSEFDILLGIIHTDGVLFSSHQTQAVWFLKRFDPTDEEEERMERISDKSGRDQFFSSVITGSLQGGETLVLANSTFFDMWSQDTVIHLIDTAKSTEELVETLYSLGRQKELRQEASALLILGLDPETEEEITEDQDEEGDEEPDVASLTRSVVVSVTPLMRTTIHGLWLGARWSGKNLVKALQKMRESSVRLPSLGRWLVKAFTSIAGGTLRILAMIWSAMRTFFLLIALGVTVMIGASTQQDALGEILRTEPFARWTHMVGSITNATSTNRTLKGISAVMVLAILLVATMVTRFQYERVQQAQRNRAAEIEQKAVQARAGLIYGNDRDAKRLLEEARALLKDLPDRNADQSHQKIVTELDSVAKQLRHEIELGTPIVDIAAPAGAQRLALNQQVLLTVSPTAVGVFDHAALKAKPTPRSVPLPPTAIQSIRSVEMPSSGVVLIHDGNKVHRVAVGQKTSLTTVTIPSQVGNARTTYNNRLYAVDALATTIIRLAPSGSGWTKPEPWLTSGDASVPTNPLFMAVDGSVYLATGSSVYKYYRGAQEPFLFSVEPPLASLQSFRLAAHSPTLLLVDNHNRIIIVNKGEDNKENGGRVRAQLIHSSWKNLKDAVMDGKAKIVTVLADGRIQQFKLPAF